MDILMSKTCWVHKKWNKITSDIQLVFYSSTTTMMHGPINIRFTWGIHSFLNLALNGGERLAANHGHFTPRESNHGFHYTEGWLGTLASLDTSERKNVSCSCWESKWFLRSPAVYCQCATIYYFYFQYYHVSGSTLLFSRLTYKPLMKELVHH